MKRLPLAVLAFLLLGAQDCDAPDPNPGNSFCAENEYSILGHVRNAAAELEGGVRVGKSINTILRGDPSTNRRSTVRVHFGGSYCSGVALGPRVVLSAGHCGYAETTDHDVQLGNYGSKVYEVERHIPHPDYLRWKASGDTDHEARKGDLMILIMDEDVPGPYPRGFYDKNDPVQYKFCRGAVAQGWGQHETLCVGGDEARKICETSDDCPGGVCSHGGIDLRETKYIVTQSSDPKALRLIARHLGDDDESGFICFGDSGGPLYVDVNGEVFLAGITTTTFHNDPPCEGGGTHVNVTYPAFLQWIVTNTVDENGDSLLAFPVPG